MVSNRRRGQRRRRRRYRYQQPPKKKEIFDSEVELKLDEFTKNHHPLSSLKESKIESFFTGSSNYRVHFNAQNNKRNSYIASMVAVIHKGNRRLSTINLAFALAAAIARTDNELITCLLNLRWVGVKVVLKALCVLDMRRRLQAVCKHAAKSELSSHKISKRKLRRFQVTGDIRQWHKVNPKGRSLTGAVAAYFRAWTRILEKDELDIFVNTDNDPPDICKLMWRKLADVCHFNPEKDFPASPTFLRDCFSEMTPPEGSNTQGILNSLNVNELVIKEKIPLKDIKAQGFQLCLTEESKCSVASYSDLDEVLSNYSVLECTGVDQIIVRRLESERAKFVEDDVGCPKLGKIVNFIEQFYEIQSLVRPGKVRLNLMETEDNTSIMVPTYEEADRNIGVRVYETLLDILLQQVKIYKEEMRSNYPNEPYIFYFTSHSHSEYNKQFIAKCSLIVAVFSMLTGGPVCPSENHGLGMPSTVAELKELLKNSAMPVETEIVGEKISELIDVQMVVPYFFIFTRQRCDRYEDMSSYQRFLLEVRKYVTEVNPNLILAIVSLDGCNSLLQSEVYQNALALGIKAYEYCIALPDHCTDLDSLVHLLRSTKIKLAPLKDQVQQIEDQITSSGIGIFRELAGRQTKLRKLELPLKPAAGNTEAGTKEIRKDQSQVEEGMRNLCSTYYTSTNDCMNMSGVKGEAENRREDATTSQGDLKN